MFQNNKGPCPGLSVNPAGAWLEPGLREQLKLAAGRQAAEERFAFLGCCFLNSGGHSQPFPDFLQTEGDTGSVLELFRTWESVQGVNAPTPPVRKRW